MNVDIIIKMFGNYRNKQAVIWNDKIYSYDYILSLIGYWRQNIDAFGIVAGDVVAIKSDFTPNSIALFLSLAECGCIVVPLSTDSDCSYTKKSLCRYVISVTKNDRVGIERAKGDNVSHKYYDLLRKKNCPGLVLFSSGSTGESKIIVHDLNILFNRYIKAGKAYKSIVFLLFDHIGGINTMMYLLSSGGCMVIPDSRTPRSVLKIIEKWKVQLLPTTPTFINMILLSEAYKTYDLSSLKIITYGTEPMAQIVLERLHCILPNVRLYQTYGLSEIGIVKLKSKNSESLWLKITDNNCKIKIVDGFLYVKAESSMIGYLNCPDVLDNDGWFNTGDKVEEKGGYIRILGRDSDIINVGGEKVYPSTVESVLQGMDNIADVVVYGLKNSIMGYIVCADICLKKNQEKKEFIKDLRSYCMGKLKEYMIPVKIRIVDKIEYSNRFKKNRRVS